MKMNWPFIYLKVMRRISQSLKKKGKKEREKTKSFFPSIYMKMNSSFVYLKVMRRISQSSDFILILSNGWVRVEMSWRYDSVVKKCYLPGKISEN